jgi:hypothetical protein
MDFFTVPTIRFQILYVFVVLNHARRQMVHVAVTAQPEMEWISQELLESMPFGIQPTYMSWQNPYVERYVGILGRKLLDHVIVFNEEHLKRLLTEYSSSKNPRR